MKLNRIVFFFFSFCAYRNSSQWFWSRQRPPNRLNQRTFCFDYRFSFVLYLNCVGVFDLREFILFSHHHFGWSNKKRLSGHKFAYFLASTASGLDTFLVEQIRLPIIYIEKDIRCRQNRLEVFQYLIKIKSHSLTLLCHILEMQICRQSYIYCSTNQATDQLFVDSTQFGWIDPTLPNYFGFIKRFFYRPNQSCDFWWMKKTQGWKEILKSLMMINRFGFA